jgi:putative transposase
MSIPARHSAPEQAARPTRTFFATTKTHMGRRLFQSERNATLLIEVLRACVASGKFQLHNFVVMPDHLHLLVTVRSGMTIEKAMQFVKGKYSYRLKKELGYLGEVWQRGFSEARADDGAKFLQCSEYISLNLVKAGLADSPDEYPFCFRHLAKKKQHGG